MNLKELYGTKVWEDADTAGLIQRELSRCETDDQKRDYLRDVLARIVDSVTHRDKDVIDRRPELLNLKEIYQKHEQHEFNAALFKQMGERIEELEAALAVAKDAIDYSLNAPDGVFSELQELKLFDKALAKINEVMGVE